MRKNSVKNIKINMEVRRALSKIIREDLHDPRIAPLTSVVDVKVSADLKTCMAYISVLGGEKARAETLEGLKRAEGFIRSELARTVNLRYTPSVTFVGDASIEYGINMSKKIDEITKNPKPGGE